MKKFLFLILSSFIFNFSLQATHNMAGEITYKCIDAANRIYKITVTTYAEYVGASPTDRCDLKVDFGDGTTGIAPRVNGPSGSCANATMGVIVPGTNIKKNIYEIMHQYPGSLTTYIISVADPDREAGICNIANSVNVPFYLKTEIKINNLLGPNNSVDLLNFPIDNNACVNQCFYHNPIAVDIDGDSLYYSIVSCYTTGGTIAPGYFLPANLTPNSIDHFTGTISWCSPTTQCTYSIAILIQEYRLYQNTWYKIGSVLRDMEIIVGSCTNTPPAIGNLADKCIMPGNNLNFTVTANDPGNSTLTLNAAGLPFQITPPATFTTTPPANTVTGTFDWTPSCSQIRLAPYTVTFKASDNDPTNPLVYYKTMSIKVIAPPPTNLTATTQGSCIKLNWIPSSCNSTSGSNPFVYYKIYRKDTCAPWTPNPCETGVPSYTGYKLIDTAHAGTTSYIDCAPPNGLAYGKNYSYMIVAVYADGSESYASAYACAHLTRDIPILTNVSVMSTGTNNPMWIHWVKPLGTLGNLDTVANPGPYEYRLYQAQGMNGLLSYTPIASYVHTNFFTLNDTGFVSNGLNTQNFPYSYKLEFYSNNNLIGTSSSASSIFLQSTPGDNKVNLKWNEIVPWSNYTYHIYRKNSSGTFVNIGNTTDTFYVDNNLQNGKTYCYKVISEGQYIYPSIIGPLFNASQEICETPIDIEPPCQPKFKVSVDCILMQNTITWSIPTTGCENDAVKFNIYYSPTDNDPFKLIYSTMNTSDTSYVHVNDYYGTPSVAGCYKVTAVDTFNNESIVIEPYCVDNCPEYELPNVFTPNGDGKNDLFMPLPYAFVKDINIKIYDRWGIVMFETNNPDIKWDGRNQDTQLLCSDGTYYYVCKVNEIRLKGIKTRILKGFVQLINDQDK